MADDARTLISTNEAPAGTQLLRTSELGRDLKPRCAHVGARAKVDSFIAVIESRAFVREIVRRSMQSAFSLPVIPYSTASELKRRFPDGSAELVILSLIDASKAACAGALDALSELVPSVPIIVLASDNDVDLARTALGHGAKGYIPCTMGFETVVEAVRFVLAGGTCVPVEATRRSGIPESQISQLLGIITSRELAVVRAIQQGKSNKVIAHELNMAVSTVKVHLYNVMRKWRAKNRTDVAIKAQAAMALGVEEASGKIAPDRHRSAAALALGMEGSMRATVESKVQKLLPRGKVSRQTIAKSLALSERTLMRRLADEGTTYAEVADQLRRSLALEYVKEPGLPLSQMAYLLGYQEPTSFNHAFKRWTGRSPSMARNERPVG
jgi:DNA-binding NarL/FixJ family response regulator